MPKEIIIFLFIIITIITVLLTGCFPKADQWNKLLSYSKQENKQEETGNKVQLPKPKSLGKMSLEEAIYKRRSQREFQEKTLNLEQVSQILWSAQGITEPQKGLRSAPSAGALYPLEVYLVVGQDEVEKIEAGIYHYLPQEEKLERISTGDVRPQLAENSLNQNFIAQAPVSLVIAADFSRTTAKYGDRGRQYVYLEAGHAAQNVYLQTTALGLATVTVGAFDDQGVAKTINLPQNQTPLYVMPIGYPM